MKLQKLVITSFREITKASNYVEFPEIIVNLLVIVAARNYA